MCEVKKEEKIKVVICKPGMPAEVAEIENELKSLQEVVGGWIQAVYPFEEPVCIVCNDEGKLMGLPLNRALYDEDGEIYDIISGTFFICDCSGEDFGSLNEEQIERYLKMYELAEEYVVLGGRIVKL